MIRSKSFTNLFQFNENQNQFENQEKLSKNNHVKRKYINLVTNTGVRRLLIPQKRPTYTSCGVINEDKFNLIQNNIKDYIEPENKFDKALRILQEKEQKALECENRKLILQECARRCKTAGSGREKIQLAEDLQRDNLLISRAIELQREREDEMKLCNSLLLSSKCQTIRDAQIAEKMLITKELKAVELELDKIMENVRLKAIEDEEKKREQEEIKKKIQFQNLSKQIQLNEELKKMAVSALEKERQRIRQIEENRKQEIENEKKQKLIEQEKRKKEIDEANQEIKRIREENSKYEIEMNNKIQFILKARLQDQDRKEKEKKKIQMLKDKEFARLEKERKRNEESKEYQYNVKCRQLQEECDREWRRKEIEEQKKRKQMTEDLIKCRTMQEEYKRKYQALEIEKSLELNEVLEKQRIMDLEKEKMALENRKKKTLEYRKNLQKLIKEKNNEKQKNYEENIENSRKLKQEHISRIEGLKSTISRKIAEVRNQNVPDKYLNQVELQMQKQLMKIKI